MPSKFAKHVPPGKGIERRRVEVRMSVPQMLALRQAANVRRLSVNELMLRMVDRYLRHPQDQL